MTQRDKHFSLRVLALAGTALVLLVVDVVLLTRIVRPSATSTRIAPAGMIARDAGAGLALVLPTHNTGRPGRLERPRVPPHPG